MADYQDIRGLRVKYLSADPSVTVGGEVWYNSTTGTLKSRLVNEAWRSAMPLISPVGQNAGAGIQTAALSIDGGTGPSPSYRTATEEYNGTGWSIGGVTSFSTGYLGACGTQTAALAGGGDNNPPGACDEYNGTAWTGGGALGLDAYQGRFAGTQTATVAAGLYYTAEAYEYNGASWTATGSDMPTHTNSTGGVGTQTAAAFLCGGNVVGGAASNLTQEWNGSSWSLGPANTISGTGGGASGAAPADDCLMMGQGSPHNRVSRFDGTAWSTSPATMATARYDGGGAGGSSSSGLRMGGNAPPYTNAVEEFNVTTSVITAGVWASGNNMNQTRRGIASATAGTQTAALGAMGYTSPPGGVGRSDAETYDGSTWTAITALPVTRYFGGGFGTQGAAVIVGGYSTVPGASQKEETYEWNGSSWSQTGNQGAGISNYACPGVGIESAGMIAGGMPTPTNWQLTQEYNGSVWATSPGSLNTGRTSGGGAGTQTAAIAAGGDIGPTYTLSSEEYDGSTWTATGNSLYNWYGVAGAGTTTAALMYSQLNVSPFEAQSQGWDGSAWSTSPALNTARQQMGGAGTATAAVGFSGNVMPGSTTTTNATEEFTGQTSAANIITLTTS